MECWLEDSRGTRLTLPPQTQWRFSYTSGTPADSFEVECLWGEQADERLTGGVYFLAREGSERVFTGLVDECESRWDESGSRLSIRGRGMAARLLDNEARGADYQVATWADILRDHVTPYGITALGGENLPHVSGFSIATGNSEWSVVYQFARYYGGVEPRFDRLGRLVVEDASAGRHLVLDQTCPVTSLLLRDKRYGVLSQVLLRNPNDQGEQTVVNETFAAQGGMRRQVLTMPRKSGYEAMRYRGEYQIDCSAEELRRLELRAAAPWLAFPGDRVELRLERPRLTGLWRVRESVCGCGAQGNYTELDLCPQAQ